MSKSRHPSGHHVADAEGGEDFLSRWSRLKHTGGEDEQTPVAHGNEGESLADEPVAAAGDASPPEAKPLPSLDSLDEHSDYSGFLSPEVSEELQRLAMRKLFRLPSFNVVDGLNDYDEDFRSFEPMGQLITHEMRRMWQREADKGRDQDEEELPDQDTGMVAASQDDGLSADTKPVDGQDVASGDDVLDEEDPGSRGC